VASAGAAPAEAADFSGKTVADLRSAIRRSIIAPLNMVMITRDRIEEVLDDAVKRGRMTADDAQSVVKGLVARGRQQTDDVLSNLESLLGRTRDEVESRADDARQVGTDAAGRAVKGVTSTAKTARKTADPVLVQADRARRVAGVGPSFPITGYHELTAAEVQSRLDTLSRAELRKVRDHERRNANRKTVLEAIETKLT
jgi:polyhydroxyalkanoate synthesis regulator phasin